MKLNNLQDLYIEQLQDLYSAENQLMEALPKMIEKTSHMELRRAFEQHLEETRGHAEQLEQIFQNLEEDADGETCKAMQGLIKEAEALMKKNADEDVLDAGLIASAQRVEHYEIAGYGTVATYAEMLGRTQDHRILGQILNEEKTTDEKLTRIAEQIVNVDAQ